MIKSLVILSMTTAAVQIMSAPFVKFENDPDGAACKAGKVIQAVNHFKVTPGYVLAGWSAYVHRKHAPEAFFAQPGLPIRPHSTVKAYDAVYFCNYLHFPKALTEGDFLIRFNTAGFPSGDYAIAIQGCFMKDQETVYSVATFCLTITDGDNGEFSVTKQDLPTGPNVETPVPELPVIYREFTLKPAAPEVKGGEKVHMDVAIKAADGAKITGYTLSMIRKNAPAAFFARKDITITPHKTDKDYDLFIVQAYRPNDPANDVSFSFDVDTTNYPDGEYRIHVQLRYVDASGKISYPNQLFPLKVR